MSCQQTGVKAFYEKNTRPFLHLGAGGASGALHREVWGPGVTGRDAAFQYVNHLLAERLDQRHENVHRVLDLGCGVGGSLFYLYAHAKEEVKAIGVTISEVQVIEATQRAANLGLSNHCSFLEASFSRLPFMEQMDLAYAIEAFVHAPAAGEFFTQVHGVLKPGGRLYLIDDFLERAGVVNQYIDRFKVRWKVSSLHTIKELRAFAADRGFKCIENLDLTPFLWLGRPRDRWIKFLFSIPGVRKISGDYLGSLDGGDALQTCLKKGWITYRLLGFEKVS